MKKNKKIISFLLLFCLLAGVGNVPVPGIAKAPKVKVKKVAVKAPYSKKMTLQKGQTATLKVKVTVTPNKKAYKKVTYKSSKTKVVTVSKKGVVKAKKTGSAKITVTSTKNKKKKAVIQVTVVNKASSQPTPTPQPTTAPTPAAPVDNTISIQNVEVLHPQVIRVALTRDFHLTKDAVTMSKKVYLNTNSKYPLQAIDIQKESNRSYLLFINEEDSLASMDYLTLSVAGLTGKTKEKTTQYIPSRASHTESTKLTRSVGSNLEYYVYMGRSSDITGYLNVKAENLPPGITVKEQQSNNYFTLYGTFLKTGNYKTKLTGIDEAGNTFIHTLYFGIYDEKSLAAAIDDAYFYLPSGASQVNIGQLMAVGGGSGSYLYEIGKNDWGISVNSGGWSSGYLEKEGVYPLSVTVTDANNPELKTSVSWTVYVENGATITLAVKNSKGEGINDVLIQFLPKKCTPGLGIDEKIFGIDEIQNGNYKASLPTGTYDVMITRAKSNSYAFLSNVKITADGQKLPDVVLNI